MQSELVEKEEELYYEEEDLGYYKDGAKRTLTDEQIEIFRHSEIHALLRERERLREEGAEERSDFEETNESGKTSKTAGSIQNEADRGTLKRKSVEGSQDCSAKRAKDEEGTAHPNDGNEVAGTQQGQQTTSSRDFNFGRKIVSYAEDWWRIICMMNTIPR